jgi:hypothetical protein
MIKSMQLATARRGRGGLRLGAGRPPAYREPLLRKTVTLPGSYVEQLTTFGAGNLSDGIRLLVESAYASTGTLWLRPPLADP